MTTSQSLAARIMALEEFFRRCWDAAREGSEPDGSDIQDWGEELGLLLRVTATEPCGEGCYCDEYTGSDFPTDCYRPTKAEAAHRCQLPASISEALNSVDGTYRP